MSNKRQPEILRPQRSVVIFRRCGSKQRCDLRVLEAFVCSLLLTSSILCVASAKLEAKNNHKLDSTGSGIELHSKHSTDVINHSTDENEQEQHENRLEYDHFYRSELQRLPYETINRILRDEQEPIFRREDIDLRYYHTRSLQPTHEVVRRSAEVETQISRNLNLHAQNLSKLSLAENSTNYLDAILAIDLSENRLETAELSRFKNLLTANLSHNILTELPVITNLTLESLNLNSNRIRNHQNQHFSQNNKLKALYLSDNEILNLTALNLLHFSSLETLDLSCNQLKNQETTLFPRLMHNLKYLNLAHNRLDSISRETFYNLLSLNTLLLAHNNITFIDYETFLSLPNLQYLDLSHNQLKGESIRALQGIPDLVGLSIAYNTEMGESLQEFVASWSLKEVDASGTGLCQIPAALAQAVRTLKLADNWFKIINCGDLDSYPLLQHLDLSYSHIEDIEDDAMGRLEFLEVLFLDHNQLRKVPVSLPTSLEHLFLQNNEIMDLQVVAFQGLKNLKTLDLSHNKLLYLPALPLPKLLTLNLQASGLQGLNPAIVHSLPHLRDLLLEENPIKCSDLLGIAEWASPCRIAERSNTKPIDGEQIGNVDVGQQTVAKIGLKLKFVQTHNFYEKFEGNGDRCHGAVERQMSSTLTPPNCAVELDDNNEEVEKPNALAVSVTNAPNAADIVEQPKLLPLVLFESTSKPINVHSNEDRKVYEHHVVEGAAVDKTTQTNETKNVDDLPENRTVSSELMHVIKDGKIGVMTTTIATSTESTTLIYVNHTTSSATTTTTKNISTENAQITTVKSRLPTNVATDMPETKFSVINSSRNFKPTIEALLPTMLIAPTSTLNTTSATPKIATTTNVKNLLPQTMPTEIPVTITTPAKNYVMHNTSSTRAGLLGRQRRVEAEQATMATTDTTLMDKTLPTATLSQAPDKDLAHNIVDVNKEDDSGKLTSTKNSKISENSKTSNNDAFGIQKITSTIATTTPIQHKHVTLQLHVKDRHLIGTPLLTHHGQNLLVAAEELQNNGNHITTKQAIHSISTESAAAATTPIMPTHKNLAKIQTKHTSDQLKLAVNNVEMNGSIHVELKPTEKYPSITTNPLTTTRSPHKTVQKPRNELQKKKPSLIMKKMTITTKHASSTKAPSTPKEPHHHQQQQHHHYTLNTPRENEVTLMAKLPTETLFNTNYQANLETSMKHQFHHGNIKHSTVNTPIINGHEHELQTFQEHNELEEAAAAAAHASTSAIVSKMTQTGSAPTSNSAKWYDIRKTPVSAHPGIVILLSFGLFVVLLIGLLHVYRCDIPWPLRRQRHQQRPYRMHQQHQHPQQQQTHFNDDDVHSFLSYQSNCSNNHFNQRKWRLETTQKQQKSTAIQHHQQRAQEQRQHQSPFHNLQVRELQQTSAIEAEPKYGKQTYKISSALGERSNSQTSSSCSPHSSGAFDDETFYIEMTTDMGQTMNTDASTLVHSDLLPMELLNVSKVTFGKTDELETTSQTLNSSAFQTSSFDEETTTQSSTKLTPTTRKLGIW